MKPQKIYICPESELRMCEEEMGRLRKAIYDAEVSLDEGTADVKNAKILDKLGNFEIRLQTLQMRHAQLVFSKFGESVNPFGKIIWRN